MLFEEYKKIFEQVLELTEKIETLSSKMKSDETDILFQQRNDLMQKLDVPEDIDDEKFQQILDIKEKITALNSKISKNMKKEKEKAVSELDKIKKQANALNVQAPDTTQKIPLKNNFQPPKSSGGGSIFS